MAKRRGLTQGPVAKIIEAGYGMTHGSGALFFRAGVQPGTGDPSDWDEMLNRIKKIAYNDFDGARIAMMLGFYANSGYFSLVEFGREYSPVLYLHFNDSTNKRTQIGKLAAGNLVEIDQFLKGLQAGYEIAPREANWDAAHRCLRLWWD
jgi:hypothetical protein